MEVKRNGRLTTHVVYLDITRAGAFASPATDGKIWPSKAVITYQYLYSTGRWNVLHAVILGHRSRHRTAGTGVKVTMHKPENWPVWLHGHVVANTPVALAEPEMVQPEVTS